MVGYQVNPEDMLLLKVHHVSSLFKRAGFEADTRPGDIAPNTVYRYFGRNFHVVLVVGSIFSNDLAHRGP